MLAPCAKCHLLHATARACPRLLTEAQIRLALDEVKIISGGDPIATKQNRDTLQQILKTRKASRTEAVSSAMLKQPAPAPTLHPNANTTIHTLSHPQQTRAVQPPDPPEQPLLFAPVQDESSESNSQTESGSDSSESESDEEDD